MRVSHNMPVKIILICCCFYLHNLLESFYICSQDDCWQQTSCRFEVRDFTPCLCMGIFAFVQNQLYWNYYPVRIAHELDQF
jgi:hypothetical protein